MSRRDSGSIARSEGGLPAAFTDPARRMWGVQFHPEASHCEHGMEVLEAFVVDIAGARREWNMDDVPPDRARASSRGG